MALGRLASGATAIFRWGVTAVLPGTYRVSYRVAAGLQGMGAPRALLPDGRSASGMFTVRIQAAPVASYITPSARLRRRRERQLMPKIAVHIGEFSHDQVGGVPLTRPQPRRGQSTSRSRRSYSASAAA